MAVKIFGDDMEVLRRKAEEAARLLKTVKGVADLRVEQVGGQPYLNLKIDRRKIARYGINVADIQEVIETAIGGRVATEIIEGQLRVGVQVRFPEGRRNTPEAIGNILVDAPGGRRIPLSELATIKQEEGPVQISREDASRRIVVEFNVEGRDIGSLVTDGQEILQARLGLPPGYYITWGGAFENQQRAMRRLMLIVPATVAVIFLLLFLTFNSLRYAALIILNLPLALIGGILGLLVTGLYLSVPAAVGFIALFGVAVLNGVVLVSQFNQLRQGGSAAGGRGVAGLRTAVAAGFDDCAGGHLGLDSPAFCQRARVGSATSPGCGGGFRVVHVHAADPHRAAGALPALR